MGVRDIEFGNAQAPKLQIEKMKSSALPDNQMQRSIPNNLNAEGIKQLNYPPNNGFVSGSESPTVAQTGEILMQYGDPARGSTYFTNPGTSPGSISLPPSNNGAINYYEVSKPFPMLSGEAAPWSPWGGVGGGTQYLAPGNTQWLLHNEYIVPFH